MTTTLDLHFPVHPEWTTTHDARWMSEGYAQAVAGWDWEGNEATGGLMVMWWGSPEGSPLPIDRYRHVLEFRLGDVPTTDCYEHNRQVDDWSLSDD